MAESLLSNVGLSGLKTWQKVAIVGGGLGVGVLAYYEYKKNASSSATANTTVANSTAPATVTDPTTGETYSATAIDPADGETYEEEIDQYGSVQAAEEAYGQNFGSYTDPSSTTQTSTTGYASNAAWSQAVTSGLSDIGYSATDVADALGYYLQGKPLPILPDGTDAFQLMQTALAEYGPPPTGTFALLQATPPPSTTKSTTTSSGNVSVPNVVGRTDLDTAEGIITSAGLKASATGDSGVGNKGSVTSQSPTAGTSVAKGSTVTLTYTVKGTTTTTKPAPKATPKVTVPSVVGLEADQAQPNLSSVGLKSTLSGPAFKAGGSTVRIITAQSPKAGSSVDKGSSVKLTYKVQQNSLTPKGK
jgi:PASTA domain